MHSNLARRVVTENVVRQLTKTPDVGAGMKDRRETKLVNQLATHVPDLVLSSAYDRSLPHSQKFEGILMFADISGFTALCERYSMDSRSGRGTDRLTKVLNEYLGLIVENILSSEGDILKFAGDAFLALWKIKRDNLDFSIRRIIKCATRIQERCDNWHTDVGVKLRVKIGLSVGQIRVTTVGNQECCHFVLSGLAVDDANKAEKFASSGSIILSPKIWAYCPDQHLITHEVLSDAKHVEVFEYLSEPPPEDMMLLEQDPEPDTKQAWGALLEPMVKQGARRRPVSPWRRFSARPHSSLSKVGQSSHDSLATPSDEAEVIAAEDAQGRKRITVFTSMTDDEKARLRKYIIRPVLQKIDDGVLLEYLSEMRQVSVLFINLIFLIDISDDMGSLQTVFTIIYKELAISEGCLNKIFMFDKGCTFLCMFGVPGYKHEDDCARALKCSYQISERLKNAPNVSQVSIGVTTGSSFCGVVGHVHRHEYTVIGRKVNMAARLMMHYPSKVSCDPETYHHSKLPRHFFRQLPHREMKGVRQSGVIHEYTEDENAPGQVIRTRSLLPFNEHMNVPEFAYPLLGRDQEINIFMQEMQNVIKHRNNRRKHRHLIVAHGEAGIGKSRFLDAAMAVADQLGMRIISLALSVNEASMPYYTARALMTLLLQMENCVGHLEREHVLLDLILEPSIRDKLCLLNDLLILKFPQCPKLLHMGSEERVEELHSLLVRIVHKFTKEHCVIFVVDDAHYIDQYSWEFLNDLVEDSSTVCLLAMRPPSGEIAPPCQAAKKLISYRSTMHIKLRPVDGDHIAAMACQMLDVVSVPEDLVSVLQDKCHGVPSWCEQILHDMLQESSIELVPENSSRVEANRVQPKPEVIQKRRDSILSQGNRRPSIVSKRSVDELLRSKAKDKAAEESDTANESEDVAGEAAKPAMVCILAPNVDLAQLSIPNSLKGMMLSRIDQLKPSEQLLVKCAAVLGTSFTRDMLFAVMPTSMKDDYPKFRKAIHVLIQLGIIECDSPHSKDSNRLSASAICSYFTHVQGHGQGKKFQIRTECNCPPEEGENSENICADDGSEENLLVSNCRNFKFTNSLLRETANDLLLADQKRKLHRKSAEYLEAHAHKCAACGGGQFMPSHAEYHEGTGSATAETEDSETPLTPRDQSGSTDARVAKSAGDGLGDESDESIERQLHDVITAPIKKGVVRFDASSNNASVSTIGSSGREKLRKRRPTSGEPLKQKEPKETLDPSIDTGDERITNKRYSVINFKSSVQKTPSIISFEEKSEEDTSTTDGLIFDDLDFRECTCLEVLNTVFPQLVHHWRAAGNTSKTIHFLVEAGGAAIAVGNNMQALTFLNEANDIIKQLDAGEKPDDHDPDDHVTVETETRGKIQSMVGKSYFQMEQMEESLPYFLEALRILRNKQPRSTVALYAKTLKESIVQAMHRTFPGIFIGKASSGKEVRLLEQSRCFTHIWHLHHSQHWLLGALSAALQQVNRAEKVDRDLEELVNAYINMIECCHEYGWMSLGKRYEKLAMMRCCKSGAQLNLDNLVTIGRLYSVSMQTRLANGRIQRAIDSGYSAYKIAEKIHDNGLQLQVLPILANALLLSGRITSSVEVLEKLEYAATEEEDIVALCWYFCSCLDLHFEAETSLETLHRCLTFYQTSGTDQVFITNNVCQFYLVVSFALWFCRKEDWVSAERWLLAAESIQPEGIHTLKALQAALKLAECYLLGYCRILTTNGGRSKATAKTKKDTEKYMKDLRRDMKRFPAMQPRYDLLWIYFTALSRGVSSGLRKKFARQRALSESHSNVQDLEWSRACEKAWFHEAPPLVRKSSIEKTELEQIFASKGKEPRAKFVLPLTMA